ncbi:efflux RND transporter permease subunit [Tumebacillus sp. DT12]|uniref:Efflux RND transporter permease subunit n=1 Tax=Tumebacillus lacus TaxID=2995335 RepID=A0ABT3X2Q4_9BACL|nr:efflux RND transporter permease subunit [Tumebacillus lacus]MCX7571187.1 efflux RND transporter permease subunit [Tumebacillus lacus]
MNALTRVSLKNPIAIFILSFLLIVSGTYAFQSLKVDLLPNIDVPQLSIEAVYPGASPDVIEKQVTSKLESQLKNVEGVDQITSQTFESVALIQLTFPFDTDMNATQQKVEDLIGKTVLPSEVKPEVSRFSFGSFPIINAAITAKGSTDVQKLLEEEIQPELEKIPGVNSVAVGGTAKELVTITLNKEQALKSGLTLSKVQEAIKTKFLSMPAGTVVNDSILVPIRVEESLDTVADLESLKINETLTLKDIATIKKTTSKPEIIRYNDQESIALTVTKKQDANTVELADQTLAVLDSYSDQIEYGLVLNQADSIKKSVESLIKEGLLGALFASLAVLLFLRNIRATIIAVLSIPLSLLVSAIFLAQANITLNVMTLGGMAVAVGRVVDDSIVVIENIFRRMKNNREGLDRRELTIQATAEMLKAITSSTLTTIVVFLPLGFVGGITGEFFLPFALTIVFALLTSLIVSITLTPVLAKLSFSKVTHEEKEDALQRFYARVIEASLRRKWVVYVVSLVLLVGSLSLTSQLGFVFLPNESQKLLSATVTLPPSTVISKTNDVSLQIEKMLKEHDTVETVFVGLGSRNFQTGLKQENTASYFISLQGDAVVQEEVDAIEAKMSEIVKQSAEKSTVSVMEMSTGGPPSNNNVNIDLYSNDQDKLIAASQQVEEFLTKREDLRYVTNNMREKQKTWVIEIDPQKASDYGVSAFTVLGLTADQTRPVSVGNLTLDGKDQSVELVYDRPLASKSELEDLTLFGTKGPVPLKEVAAVKEVEAISTIQKFDAKVFARVSATIDAPNVQAVSAATIAAVKAEVELPEGVSLEAGGGSDETTQTFKDLGLAMLVAVGLVYLVMLFTFGQARVPIIILSSLLFVPVGAVLGLYVMNEPLSISAMIGVLMLIGIVVTNAIVLVDRVGQNREQGMKIRDALIEAGKTRLRPILMTAFATICALIPLALTSAEGNVISKGLAVVVIGGLLFATLLTLVIVPVTYELFFLRTHRKEQAANENSRQ